MENENSITVINSRLPFEPTCPECGCLVAVEQNKEGGYYVKCENCNSTWSTSPFGVPTEESNWLEQFHVDKRISTPQSNGEKPETSPTKVLMEIARSSSTLKKAYELVCQAYDLINEDKVARQYIDFNAKVVWHQFVWDILMRQYNIDNPDSKEVYHLRAFDYYGIHPGMLVGEGEVEGN